MGGITEDDFGDFRISPSYNPLGQSSVTTPKSITPATSYAALQIPAWYSHYRLKRVPSNPTVLKDEKRSDTEHRSIANQASAQDGIAVPVIDEEVYEKSTMIENGTTTPSDERSKTKGNTELEEVKTECTLLTVAKYPSLPYASAACEETYEPSIAKRLAYGHDTGNAKVFASGGKESVTSLFLSTSPMLMPVTVHLVLGLSR
jgi:hypothetical protein